MPVHSSKAKTLRRLEGAIPSAEVLPQFTFLAKQWRSDSKKILKQLTDEGWWAFPLIVRSSASGEDSASASQAGKYLSIGNVLGQAAATEAIQKVIESYGSGSPADEVLIQPYLRGVRLSGVAFSQEPSTGAPYYIVNYDDSSGHTDSVTGGKTNETRTFYVHNSLTHVPPGDAGRVLQLIREVETALKLKAVDIEFAITADNRLFLLQARPLVVSAQHQAIDLTPTLREIHDKIAVFNQPHPYLQGKQTVLGVMPDWNPAEIIGIRPKALALSLYCEIVTDNIWAYQRDNYGYRNLRSFPLLLKLGGQPYIDVRVSFNSFIPADVESHLAEKLATYYLQRLVDSPSYHDKVEFEVVYSCYTFDLPDRLQKLRAFGFSEAEITTLTDKLRNLTNRILHGDTALWKKDIQKIHRLPSRQATIEQSSLDPISKIYWLLEDCKRYGTLPFAGLARAAFISVQMLKSLEAIGILTKQEIERFMSGLNTVSSQMTADRSKMDRDSFLQKYGHLRPGTYDILSPRYDEDPDRYFDWAKPPAHQHSSDPFALSLNQMRQINDLLKAHQMQYDVLGLFEFIKAAIEGREFSKFVFSKSLSDALKTLKDFGEANGFSTQDLAHLNIGVVRALYGSTQNPVDAFRNSIERSRDAYGITEQLCLPSLITAPSDVYAFEQLRYQPNFITLKRVSGPVAEIAQKANQRTGLANSILFIPSADPGYDWIFSHGIAGFITMYGGANSHMAIRAAELGIPAVIGAGESLYKSWVRAANVELDCGNRQVRVLA